MFDRRQYDTFIDTVCPVGVAAFAIVDRVTGRAVAFTNHSMR